MPTSAPALDCAASCQSDLPSAPAPDPFLMKPHTCPSGTHAPAAPGCQPAGHHAPEGQRRCPGCGGTSVIRHGSFRMASGRRIQRYLCKSCRRTFSPNTGTPAYRIRKLEGWREMVELLADDLSLRRIASRLGIALSTAFRWRHRALAVLSAQHRGPLGGDVRVRTFLVKYSEKGSRITNGPGSWGYWNIVRRGPGPERDPHCGPARTSRPRFRLLIEGRPLHVMVAETVGGYELSILGQGRQTPEMLELGLCEMVRPGSRLIVFGGNEFKAACESLGYVYEDGYAAAARQPNPAPSEPAGGAGTEAEADPASAVRVCSQFPKLPSGWLAQFRGVATKYLDRYLAWFRDIIRIVHYPDGADIAPVDGRALLRVPAC